ncbi:MAG: hypothetical protein MRERC_7c015 [Mycoplasmataceae bacterium RC_NB112A]|nr:MAG: hypothetical protein MRERC_10c038 [Mycoplasmataceae bacterium RC_NB112A]KLL01864.1 MAG: hypothetical protein MRERC_7c015 [Mycoplasmataceae bacterium RC_NB112A]
MFLEFERAATKGKKLIQPRNIMIVSELGIIDKLITKSRLELLACLQEKKLNTVQVLADLLNRNFENIQEDIRVLDVLNIIKLEKVNHNFCPVALYSRIIFDLSTQETFSPQPIAVFGVNK